MFFPKTFHSTICRISVGRCNKSYRKSSTQTRETGRETSLTSLNSKQSQTVKMLTLLSMIPDRITQAGKNKISIHHFPIEMQCPSKMTWSQTTCSRQEVEDKCNISILKISKFRLKPRQYKTNSSSWMSSAFDLNVCFWWK